MRVLSDQLPPLPSPAELPREAVADNALAADAYTYVLTQVTAAEAAVCGVWDELSQYVTTSLDTAEPDVIPPVQIAFGDLDNVMSELERPINKIFNGLINKIGKTLDEVQNWLYLDGIGTPYTPADIAAVELADDLDILTAYVPPIRDFLGEVLGYVPNGGTLVPPESPPMWADPPQPDATPGRPPVSVRQPVPGLVVPPMPEFPPHYPTTPEAPADDDVLPTDPPASPPGETSPPPPAVTVTQGGGDGDCCPVNVTVHVPPPVVTVVPPYPQPCPEPEESGEEPAEESDTPLSPPESPPPPPPPTLATGGLPTHPWQGAAVPVDWGNTDICPDVLRKVMDVQGVVGQVGENTPTGGSASFLGKAAEAIVQYTSPGVWQQLGVDAATAKTSADLIATTFAETFSAAKVWDRVSGAMTPAGIPNPAAAAFFGGRLAIAEKLENNSGFPATYLSMSDTYMMQFSNPQFLPTQIQLNNTYLGGEIDEGYWQCLTQALGNHPEPMRRVLVAQQSQPNIGELVALYHRGVLSRQQLDGRLRKLGVLKPELADEWIRLFQVLPPLSDLLRFMVRDSADEGIVKTYGYDSEFTEKYRGKIVEWAKALGVDPTVFLYYWRAHWRIPSDTQLFEMLHRLRPDRPEVMNWANTYLNHTTGETLPGSPPRPLSVTAEDVRDALKINDVAPGWVDRLMAVSYAPITRTDAVRAYIIGGLDDVGLRDKFRDLGYTKKDAEELVGFYRLQKAQRVANTTGTWTTRKTARYYRSGMIDREEAERLLMRLVGDPKIAASIIDGVHLEREAEHRGKVIRGVMRGYRYGEITRTQAESRLIEAGVDQFAIVQMIDGWEVERETRWKQPTVAQLTGWLTKFIMPAAEVERRLRNLGYSQDDAERIITLAIMKAEDAKKVLPAEVGGVFESRVNNAKAARAQNTQALERRAAALVSELDRIREEMNKRLKELGLAPLAELVFR